MLKKENDPKELQLIKNFILVTKLNYAGFAVNNPGATAPKRRTNGVTYEHMIRMLRIE